MRIAAGYFQIELQADIICMSGQWGFSLVGIRFDKLFMLRRPRGDIIGSIDSVVEHSRPQWNMGYNERRQMTKSTTKISCMTSILAIALMLAMSACGSGPINPTASSSSNSSSSSGVSTASTSAANSNCLIGTWNLTDFSFYLNAYKSYLEATGSVSISSEPGTGTARIVFSSDGTATFTAAKLEQKFTVTQTAGGKSVKRSVAVDIDGAGSSKYSVNGDQISFSDQDISSLNTIITEMGITAPDTFNLMGKAGTIKTYYFSCPDANALNLNEVSTQGKTDLAPITFTRTN